ncbi:MAG: GGDEF domain-containing protein [Cellvibrio sp.]|uniref:GGDEF domain-containing protein n=1 Tax=Cellvibrio sp. TaxID=1965322 RepID=UPI0031B16F0D
MNDKSFNAALLLAIVLTLVAIVAQKYFPQKHFLAWPNAALDSYFYSSADDSSAPAAFWLNQQQNQWRCVYPKNDGSEYFACSFNVLFEKAADRGVDLSGYSHLNLSIRYTGNARKLRIYLRNFDPTYSMVEDTNSTKFNALILHTKDLNKELRIGMDEFIVSEWWLGQYDIPRELSRPDLRNVVTFGMDYVEGNQPGNHDATIEKIEFVGEWISAEKWYLCILGCWMLGIFAYAIFRLTHLQQQTRHDVQVINQLSDKNALLKQETAKFRRLSTVDSLTQTYNRFGIDQVVANLIATNKESDQPQAAIHFALIIIDVDHFKRINDRRGHDVGDHVLKNIAAIIAKGIRDQDSLGRWGGEEFIVIMPDADKELAAETAEKIRMCIYETIFEPENPLSITASFGISERLANEDFASAFKRADKALYEAKAQGRNCSVIADDVL